MSDTERYIVETKHDFENPMLDEIDLDKRYSNDDVALGGKSNGQSIDSDSLLSLELNAPECQVRTPEQQGLWCQKRAMHLGTLAKTLLHFPYCQDALLQLCRDPKAKKLFGLLKVEPDESVIICYSRKLAQEVEVLLLAHQNGTLQQCTFGELSALIVDEYHLSYVLFAKSLTLEILSDHRRVSSEQTPSLLASQKLEFENKYGLDWGTSTSLIRILRMNLLTANQLKHLLTTTNLRVCVKLAKMHYEIYGGYNRPGFTKKELISEGVEGMMHAADLYVYGVSARFVTYATNWVKLKISRFAKRNSLTVEVPVHVNHLVQQIIVQFRKHQKVHPGELSKRGDLECIIGKKINESTWVLAQNEFSNSPSMVGCSTTNAEDGLLSFDGFTSTETSDVASALDGRKIFAIIDDMVDPSLGLDVFSRKKPINPLNVKISTLQYQIFQMSVVGEMTNAEIAERLSGELMIKLEAKHVRAEYKRALECVKIRMSAENIEL